MPPTFLLLFFVGPALLLGLIAFLTSVLLGLGKQQSAWIHLTRGAFSALGALVGYVGGGLAVIVVGAVKGPTSALSPAGAGAGILIGLAIGALMGGILALRFVRMAYSFTSWLAHKTGVAEARG